jgi:hypothetical protein
MIEVDIEALQVDSTIVGLSSHLARTCLEFEDTFAVVTAPDVSFIDGVIEADIAVEAGRSFHGLVWRAEDDENYESFFLRPHQVGNPDSIQYTPVNHGISSWQLYHGDGYWAPVDFPVDEWFTVRIIFTGLSAEVFVADLNVPVLVIEQLKREPIEGSVGLLVGGPGLRVARFAHSPKAVEIPVRIPKAPPPEGTIPMWEVSAPFPEPELGKSNQAPQHLLDHATWTVLEVDRTGLADISRLHGLDRGNTVLAKAVITSDVEKVVTLEFGYSDRAVVYLNGTALFTGDDTYRSRDYRFLGSIGYWYRLYLPLVVGPNELVIAVSEDFGGWGLQARLVDPTIAGSG